MAGIKKKKPQPTFFDQQKQKLGDGWLYLTTTDTIKRNAMRILKDIAFGNINPYDDAQYFVPDFVFNVKVGADENASYHYWTYVGLSQYLKTYQASDAEKVMCEHYNQYIAYYNASIAMNTILNVISTMGEQYVPSALMQAMTMLSPFKYYYNGYYINIEQPGNRRVNVPRREIGDGRINNNGESFSGKSTSNFWQEPDTSNM